VICGKKHTSSSTRPRRRRAGDHGHGEHRGVIANSVRRVRCAARAFKEGDPGLSSSTRRGCAAKMRVVPPVCPLPSLDNTDWRTNPDADPLRTYDGYTLARGSAPVGLLRAIQLLPSLNAVVQPLPHGVTARARGPRHGPMATSSSGSIFVRLRLVRLAVLIPGP